LQLLISSQGSSGEQDDGIIQALAHAGVTKKCGPELGGKMCILSKMLAILYNEKKERVVLISNYTETLDIFQDICRIYKYPYLRLDGGTSVKKRQLLVDQFNDPRSHQFAFLLSRSKNDTVFWYFGDCTTLSLHVATVCTAKLADVESIW
jgi:SNF2 family DNA or RNA helicase